MIIGLCGSAGAGKDTVGGIIKELYPEFELVSFADGLKKVVSALFGYPYERLLGLTPDDRTWREEKDPYWSEKLGYWVSPRVMLQVIGTDVLRKTFHNDIWLDCLFGKIDKENIKNCVITDCRFANEVDEVMARGGIVVEIERERAAHYDAALAYEKTKDESLLEGLKGVHRSEVDWIGKTDRRIENKGSVEELREKVKVFLDEVLK